MINKDDEEYPLTTSEKRTRYSLIDPVLRALGWKIESSKDLIIEFGRGEGRVDYALLNSAGEPCIIIESKKLDGLEGNLQEKDTEHQRQLVGYMKGMKAGYGVLTNGKYWYISDAKKQARGPWSRLVEARKLMPINITDGETRDAAKSLFDKLARKHWR